MELLVLLFVLVVLGVTLASSYTDFTSLRIPNLHSIIIIAAFIPAYLAGGAESFGPLWHHLAAMVAIFAITYLMFAMGMMGGGDAKLGTALGLWLGLSGLVPFLFFMALTGGGLGGLALWMRKKKPFKNPKPGSWIAAAQGGENAVPYGIAISVGTWAAFFHTGLISLFK